MALLLRTIDEQRLLKPQQESQIRTVGERVNLGELVDEIRHIFRKELDQAERA